MIEGIPVLGPGGLRVLTWGQLGAHRETLVASRLERTLALTIDPGVCWDARGDLVPRQTGNLRRSPIRRRSARRHPSVYGYALKLNDACWRRGLLPIKIESRRIPHAIGDPDVQFLSLR